MDLTQRPATTKCPLVGCADALMIEYSLFFPGLFFHIFRIASHPESRPPLHP